MPAEAALAVSDVEVRTLHKLRRRIIPLLVLLYVVAYVDRINIGFAALTMNAAHWQSRQLLQEFLPSKLA